MPNKTKLKTSQTKNTLLRRGWNIVVSVSAFGGLIIFVLISGTKTARIDLASTAVPVPEAIQNTDDASGAISLLFVGDMMFDRGVARHAEKYGADSLLRGMGDILRGNDAVIGNLEGTITTETPVAKSGGSVLRFTFNPAFAGALKAEGFTAFSLANNHSLDFYNEGFEETKKFLDENGLLYFGSANNDSGLSANFTSHGKKICLVGYHDLYTFDPKPAVSEIEKIRPECDFVVLFAHWGEEYKQKQSPRQVALAHGFIDAGADLVIGAHPHVVEPVEIYKNKAIFYSLGNFIFDQGLSFWTEHGLAVRVELGGDEDDEVKFTLISTALDKTEVSVAGPEEAEMILKATGLDSAEFTLKR